MIDRLRLFLVCLILAALPLQGFAAASMSLCHPAPVAAQADHHAPHEVHDGHDAQSKPDAASPDLDHRCGLCAFCGHAMALPGQAVTLVQPVLLQPFVLTPPPRIVSRGLPVPDKPPRA